ncbi:MAG: dihydrofolate reductase, partial [Clostridiales bacterium]|nr:dihydrofolate reductase [Clostridiales bacterium]
MIGLIAAFVKGRVIGSRGRIPWNIPGEQTRFRKLTTG